MLDLKLRASFNYLRPIAPRLSLRHRIKRVEPIMSSNNSQDSVPEPTTNDASTSEPATSTSAAPLAHADGDGILGSRVLFCSIFALTVLVWSSTRYFMAGQPLSNSHGQTTATTAIRDTNPKLKDRRRLRSDAGGQKNVATAKREESEAPVSASGVEKNLPASLSLDPPIPEPSPSSRSLEPPMTSSINNSDRDLPFLREKASAALRAAASAADASQKASSHARSSSLAAKKSSEAAQRASLAASEAQLALEEAAEEAVLAAEQRARQAAALASDLEHQAFRSAAAATAFDDLAQLQASIATESAALASSLHRKQPATDSPVKPKLNDPNSSSSNSTALKQHRLAKGFGSDPVSAGGIWLKEMGEGAKESLQGAWKRVSGGKAPGSSFTNNGNSSYKSGASSGVLSLPPSSLSPGVPPQLSTNGKPQGNGREMVPSSIQDDMPRFPPH